MSLEKYSVIGDAVAARLAKGHKTPYQFFFFNDTATTEISTLSLHDALPICPTASPALKPRSACACTGCTKSGSCRSDRKSTRPELQSQFHLVCRLLLEKKKQTFIPYHPYQKNKQKKQKNK